MSSLVTTDLNNHIEGRDFLLILVSFLVYVVGCLWFLYNILGWRFVLRQFPVSGLPLICGIHSAIVGMMIALDVWKLRGEELEYQRRKLLL